MPGLEIFCFTCPQKQIWKSRPLPSLQQASSKLFIPVFLTVNSPGNLFLVVHFDLVSLSRYTSEPYYPADRNLCHKMALSSFTGFIFVSTALERPLLYGWTYDSGSLQHDQPSTSLMNASTLVSGQCERRTWKSLNAHAVLEALLSIWPSMVSTPFSLLPDTQVPFRFTPVFFTMLWWRTPTTPKL